MNLSIRSKIAAAFIVMLTLDLMVGLGVQRIIQRYDDVVKRVVHAGGQIRNAKEILNGVREETLLLMAMTGPESRPRARALMSEIHLRIQVALENVRSDDLATLRLRTHYMTFWQRMKEGIERTSTENMSGAGLEVFVRDLLNPAIDDIEKTAMGLIEANVRETTRSNKDMAVWLHYFQFLRLPPSYYQSMEDLSSGLDHIYVYDEMWESLLRMQHQTFSSHYWSDPTSPEALSQTVENLNLWLSMEMGSGAMIDALEFFRREELALFDSIRNWLDRYPSTIGRCGAGSGREFQSCFLEGFETIREIHRRIVQHSLAEAKHVEDRMGVASESIEAVASGYMIVFLAIALLAGAVAVYVLRQVMTPLKNLQDGFALMAAGRFNFRLREERKDEFGVIESGFNRMAEAVEKRDHEVMAARIDLENLAFKIQNTSEDLEREVLRRTSELSGAYEELKKNERLKTEFIANMSHELRTPLNSIIGFSKVMLKGIDGPVSDKQKEDLTLIHQSGRHLLDLITQILDFSKIESGKLDLRKEAVNLAELAAEAVNSVRPLLRNKSVRLRQQTADDVPMVPADRTRLMQVLINLLGNAVKFTEEGEVALEIRRWTADDPLAPSEPVAFDEGVLLSVRDTGIGIPAGSADAVFQKFQQVDGSSTRAHGGTGLGLAITRELVHMHGGYIWFNSHEGEGTAFHVILPVEGAVEPGPVRP